MCVRVFNMNKLKCISVLQKAVLLSLNTLLSPHRRGIGFQKHLLFPPACLWLCHVLCTFTLTLCMCSPRWQQKYDKVEKRMSPSETNRAPGMESDQKCSITPISFPHLDIPPRSFHEILCFVSASNFLFVFLHSISTPAVSLSTFTGDYSSKVDERSFLQVQNAL